MKSNAAKIATPIIVPLSIYTLAGIGGFTFEQRVSIAVLSLFISASLLFWSYRLAFALLGVFFLLALGLLDIEHFIEFSQLDVIAFLIGMMTVIGILEERGFFDFLLAKITSYINDGKKLFIVVLLLSALMAALVDEVTSILFITSFILKITRRLGISAYPFVIGAVLATNVGSSATVVGNPIGVMIAFNAGFSFSDFIRWATPNSVVVLMLTVALSLIVWRPYVSELDARYKRSLTSQEKVTVDKMQRVNFVIFLGTITMLILHHQLEKFLEEILSLPKGSMHNAMLLGAPLLWASIGLLIERHRAKEIVSTRVDWWTLTFFMLLFASVGTLEYTGANIKIGEYTVRLGSTISNTIYNPELSTMLSLILISSLMTAFLDNVVAVATLIEITKGIAHVTGWDPFVFYWALLFSGTMAGNYTPIGSTANIVALGILEQNKEKISFSYWVKKAFVVATLQLLVSIVWLTFFVHR